MTSCHSTRFYKKTNSSQCLDLQKENSLLGYIVGISTQLLDITGRGWSRDAVINNF